MCIQQVGNKIVYIFTFIILTDSCGSIAENKLTFVFSIPTTYNYPDSPRVTITTSSPEPVNVNISIPGLGFRTSRIVTRYQHTGITLPHSVRLEKGDGTQNKTIIVQSSGPAAVYVIDNEFAGGDSFLALPIFELGTKYLVASFSSVDPKYPSFFCVSALNEKTHVGFRSYAGRENHVVLQAYESFRFDGELGEDLTGSLVVSDKPIAVVSGAYTQVPTGTDRLDGLLEQLPSAESWGRNYILSPFLGRKSGYLYRVISSEHSVLLTISGEGVASLKAFSIFERRIVGDEMISITADCPVMVIQYMTGYDSEDPPRGDPSMIVIRPLKAFTNNLTFSVLPLKVPQHVAYNVHVIVNCSAVNQLVFDNTLPWTNVGLLQNEETLMCLVRGQVGIGVHSTAVMDASERISVYVYAICTVCGTSYVFPVDMWSLPRKYNSTVFCYASYTKRSSSKDIACVLKRIFCI